MNNIIIFVINGANVYNYFKIMNCNGHDLNIT